MRPFRHHTVAAAVVQGADVGFIVQDAIHGGPMPFPATARIRSSLQRQLLGNVADRLASLHIGIEDSAHHNRFVFPDLRVRRHTVTAWNAHVSEGNFSSHNLAASRSVELAPPVPFGNLRTLELGHCSRDLVHELRERIVGRPTLQEDGLHSETFQLLQN